MSSRETAPSEHFDVLAEQSYRSSSQRLSTRMQETMQIMESAMCRMRGIEDGVEGSGYGAASLR